MSNEIASLQDTALKTIVSNFPKFISAYSNTKNENLKRNLYFLQRVYTQELFAKLEKSNVLESKYFDFLLNEHLKKVNVGLLLNYTTLDVIIDKFKCMGSSLTEVSFIQDDPEYFIDPESPESVFWILSILPHVYNVTKICIPYICTNEMLKLLAASCPHLTELDIRESSRVTNEGLKSLCVEIDNVVQAQCPLKIIDLSIICGINEGIAFILKHIPTLEKVNCLTLPAVLHYIHKCDLEMNDNCDMEINGTKEYNLTNIDFTHYEGEFLMETLKLCSKQCPHLKCIKLSVSDAEELKMCSLFKELEDVVLHYYMEPELACDINDFLVSSGAKLKSLNLDHFRLSISTLIECCPNLENLSLLKMEFLRPSKKTLKPLKYLQSLQLEWIKMSENFCAESFEILLNSCPEVELLSIRVCEFNDPKTAAKLLTFPANRNLKQLTFANTDMDIDLLQQVIINCSFLQTLSLEYCDNLSEEDVDTLRRTIAASHKKIEILWNDDRSEFSYYSDYDFDDYDNDFDNDYTDYEYGDYWDSDDYAYYYDDNDDFN